jgi:isoleucyl-tRNA synthetase
VAEPYRRLRNTLRILLGNLNGFDPRKDAVAAKDLTLIDRWILEKLYHLVSECRKAYEAYEFRKVFSLINHFTVHDLSAIYVDMTKDRLYCDAPDGVRRRATQTAMQRVFDALVTLLAPILAFTADEAWEHAGRAGSVHEADFPDPDGNYAGGEATKVVGELLDVRGLIQTAIEEKVQAKEFKKNNEAAVELTLPAGHPCAEILADRDFATEFFIVSNLVVKDGTQLAAVATRSAHPMCPRCRRYEPPVNDTELCARCDGVLTASTPA